MGGLFYEFGSLSLSGYDSVSEVYFRLSGIGGFDQWSGTYVVGDTGGVTYSVDMDFVSGSNTPFVLAATLTDTPGYSSRDTFGRNRGGSTLTFSYLGSDFVFERQE